MSVFAVVVLGVSLYALGFWHGALPRELRWTRDGVGLMQIGALGLLALMFLFAMTTRGAG